MGGSSNYSKSPEDGSHLVENRMLVSVAQSTSLDSYYSDNGILVASLTENPSYSQRLHGHKAITIEVVESIVEVIVKAAAEKAGLALERAHTDSLTG